jgi:UDP-glucose 6-dehydrogenase
LVWRRSLAVKFNVGVLGAGYVGLVTGACLAHVGQRVVCVDRDEGRVAELREGRPAEYTVKEVAELILELSNSASELSAAG